MRDHHSKLQSQKVLVIGLGVSGRSAAQYLLNRGALVWGVDKNPAQIQDTNLISKGLHFIQENEPFEIEPFDLVVVSPGIASTHPHYQAALRARKEIIGEVELACRDVKKKLLGITGTNGKTTTTLLVTHVLNEADQSVCAVGNIGLPITTELDQKTAEIFVVELSSFQLETMKSPVFDAGVILNITYDHLDRYPNFEEYARVKISLKNFLKPGGSLYVEYNCFQKFCGLFDGFNPMTYGYSPHSILYTDQFYVFFKDKIEYILPPSYRGKVSHDVENILAAYALCAEMGIKPDQFLRALQSFKKPSHRLEFVREINGVTYYNDSKATNIDAVLRAVACLKKEIILIAGGVDKGAPYTPWIASFIKQVKYVFAIGQAAEKIKIDLQKAVPVEICSSFEEAILKASQQAKSGQIVLLSPGCSSYDMFRDYAERGDKFKNIVNNLLL